MAMPVRNVTVSDKMQFLNGDGGGRGGEIRHQQQWFPDERDGFIAWLRCEFAAANAIIDSLCHHLQCVGEPGEYDTVLSCIQQRRCNWIPVLHTQQYFSVLEVVQALQQVVWRKQHRISNIGGKVTKKSVDSCYRPARKVGSVRENHRSGSTPHSIDANSLPSCTGVDGNSEKREEKGAKIEQGKQRIGAQNSEYNNLLIPTEGKEGVDEIAYSEDGGNLKNDRSLLSSKGGNLEQELKDGCTPYLKGSCKNTMTKDETNIVLNQDEELKLVPIPKSFMGIELVDGKEVNVVEGLKLYEKLLDSSEISRSVLLVNEMKAAGQRGELHGQMYVSSKRPMKGHGREMIQLGLPIADGLPEDEHMVGASKDWKVEALPNFLQDVINNLVNLQIVAVKPDSCIIDFFNEGDYSSPHVCPPWYERPFCVLFLTECDLVFGRVIGVEHPGHYKGSLKLSLTAGSLLVMQGHSADFAKHAISSLQKECIMVTFTKYHPNKRQPTDALRPPPSVPGAATQSSPWGLLPSLPRHSMGPNHYGVVSTTGVLPTPTIRPHHLPPPNVIQPLYVTPVHPAVSFSPPVTHPPASSGWALVPPRHSSPGFAVPGTGVFLPPSGSGHSAPPQQPEAALSTDTNATIGNPSWVENVVERSNCNISLSPNVKSDEKKARIQVCNGNVSGNSDGRVTIKDEKQQSADTG